MNRPLNQTCSLMIAVSASLMLSACGSSPDPQPTPAPDNTQARMQKDKPATVAKDAPDAEDEDVLSAEERAARRRAGLAGRGADPRKEPTFDDSQSDPVIETEKPAKEPLVEKAQPGVEKPAIKKATPAADDKPKVEASKGIEDPKKPEAVKAPEDTSLLDNQDHHALFLACVEQMQLCEQTFGNNRTQANYEALYLAFLDAQLHFLYLDAESEGEWESMPDDVVNASERYTEIGFSTRKTAGFDQQTKRIKAAMTRNEKLANRLAGIEE